MQRVPCDGVWRNNHAVYASYTVTLRLVIPYRSNEDGSALYDTPGRQSTGHSLEYVWQALTLQMLLLLFIAI
jgi:hypothetical protein